MSAQPSPIEHRQPPLCGEGRTRGYQVGSRRRVRVSPASARPQSAVSVSRCIASAERCLELAPHNPSSFAVVAQVELSAGHPWLARPFSEELLRLAPQWPTSHELAGDVARARELYSDAEVAYRRALELDPLSRVAHNNLGVVLLRTGKRKEALQAFQRAAELDPTDATAINNIRLMARQDRLPVPRWARVHPLLMGPGLLVALCRRIVETPL